MEEKKKVELIFQPTKLQLEFHKVLKIQFCLVRTCLDREGKVFHQFEKTQPVKITKGESLELDKLLGRLSLPTTMRYCPKTKQYASKQVELSIGLEVDGKQFKLSRLIDLKTVRESPKMGNIKFDRPQLTIFYEMEIKFLTVSQLEGSLKISKGSDRVNFKKEDQQSQCTKEESRKQLQFFMTEQNGRHKTQVQNQRQEDKKRILKKSRSVNIQEEDFDKLKEIKLTTEVKGVVKVNQGDQELRKKYNNLKGIFREVKIKLKQKDQNILELTNKIQKLQIILTQTCQTGKSLKQELKKQKTNRSSAISQVTNLQDQLRAYRQEIQKISKSTLVAKQISRNEAIFNENTIKMLKQQLKELDHKEKKGDNMWSTHIRHAKDKDEIISELQGSKLAIQGQNRELKSIIQELEEKLNCMSKKVNHLDDMMGRVSELQKQLEQKNDLLSTMQETIKESGKSPLSMQNFLHMQKMKKEFEALKKREVKWLGDKSKFQNYCSELQEEILGEKTKIASILNVIQETDDEKLISEIYGLLG